MLPNPPTEVLLREKGASWDSSACPMDTAWPLVYSLCTTPMYTPLSMPMPSTRARGVPPGLRPCACTLAACHPEQSEVTKGPAGHIHNFLSLQGHPKSLTISSDPREAGEGNVVLGRQPWTWSQRPDYGSLLGHLPQPWNLRPLYLPEALPFSLCKTEITMI